MTSTPSTLEPDPHARVREELPESPCADAGTHIPRSTDTAEPSAAGEIQRLRDEVHYWRQNAACWLKSAIEEGANPARAKASKFRQKPKERIREFGGVLQSALIGEFFGTCEACGEAVRPGDATITDVDCGEMHAGCVANGDAPVKPGDRINVDPEAIDWDDEDGPRPDHLIAGVCSPLFTDDQIAALVAKVEGRS